MSKNNIVMPFLLAGLFILLGMYVYRIFHHGELANKPIWALMQSFAAKEEYTPPHTLGVKIEPVFVKDAIKYKNLTIYWGFPRKMYNSLTIGLSPILTLIMIRLCLY